MANLIPMLKFKETDDNGDPLSGGKLYSYVAGTTTPVATYTDESGDTPNENPVELDSAGRASIFLSPSTLYKFILTDSDDNVIWTVDDVAGGSGVSISTTSWGAWAEHTVSNGQSATNLDGETVDLAMYSSAEYMVEIIRGTTVVSNGKIAVQGVNGTGSIETGLFIGALPHGVTFSVTQASTVVQLKASLDSGAGSGTIKLSRRLIPV